MESLSRDLISKLKSLESIDDFNVTFEASNKPPIQFEEPLFVIKLDCTFDQIPQEDMKTFQNLSLNHLAIVQLMIFIFFIMLFYKKKRQKNKRGKKGKVEEENDEDVTYGGTYDENKISKQIVILNISKYWIIKKPQLNSFHADIIKCIGEGLNAIQAFERWSRHYDMTQFVAVLEEWNDMVGEEWGHPESNYLHPSDWLDLASLETFTGIVKNILENAFQRADRYIEKYFNKHLLTYWEDKQINIDIFKDEKLAHPNSCTQDLQRIINVQCLMDNPQKSASYLYPGQEEP